jgi:tetratricopeptide (TPR) repeat protein
VLAHPSHVDEDTLLDLASVTKTYQKLSKNASIDILAGIVGHFTTISQLLKTAHPTSTYQKLSTLVSESALLLGRTFHDIREYDLAFGYYKFSLKIARDIGDHELWASGVGRLALLFIYWGHPQNALPWLQEAHKNDIQNQQLRLWLWAIEAEIYAMLGKSDQCFRALDRSKEVSSPLSSKDDMYSTGFNESRMLGYEGACFVRLHRPELALPALQGALASCDPTSLRRRATLFADIGIVHAQLGEVRTASELMLQSLDTTVQIKSLVVLQRVSKGRGELNRWSKSAEVQNLDDQIYETLTVLNKMKEQVE